MSMESGKAIVDIVTADTTSNSELVLELVMSHLPTKDCVRTSILSSGWRYKWTTVPRLVFNRRCCSRSCRYDSEDQVKALTSIINHVLLLHNGSIDVFQVSDLGVVPDIDRWILRVSKDSIKTLVLELLWSSVLYQLPSSLFNCGSLSRLKLVHCSLMSPPSTFKGFKNLNCLELESVTLTNDAFEKLISSCPLLKKLTLDVLQEWDTVPYRLPSVLYTYWSLSSLKLRNCSLMPPPPSFKGFKNLKCLVLEFVTLTNDALEKLISSCPLLKKLTLARVGEAENLKINTPNLEHIDIYGDIVSITFGYAMTKLSTVSILLPECADASLLDFFIKLPNIQRLELIDCHMGFMSGGSIVESFPFQSNDLYHLATSMDLCFGDERRKLCLYKGSSNLTERHKEDWFSSYFAIELGAWEDNGNCHREFKQLRQAQMDDFCGTNEEMEFLKFVLGNSPVLEEIKLIPHTDPFEVRVQREDVKSLNEFKRASKAKIFFDGLVC